MRAVAFSIAFILLVFQTVNSEAQKVGRWDSLDLTNGQGVGVCSDRTKTACLLLRCGDGRGLEIGFRSSTGAFSTEHDVYLQADWEKPVKITSASETWQGAAVDDDEKWILLSLLKSGRNAAIISNNKSYPISLRGSSKAIDKAVAHCGKLQAHYTSATSFFGDSTLRRADEATFVFEDKKDRQRAQLHKNLDIWGYDIRDGVKDPLLAGMSVSQCEALCRYSSGCKFFTHNGQNNICFLKSAVGKQKSYKRATTGQMMGATKLLPAPPTRGRGLIIDPSLTWTAQDNVASWYQKLRYKSRPLGKECRSEISRVEKLRQSLKVQVSQDGVLSVEDAIEVKWSGNDLKERLPVWLVVSSQDPVRFEGSGSFSLGPGAPNPFNINHENGSTRALTALFARGAGTAGSFRVRPIRSGKLDVKVSLMAYIRGCEQEMAEELQSLSLDIQSAQPRIVLNNMVSLSTLDRQLELPEFERRIVFNDRRLLLLSTKDGTEIADRAGAELSLSPTHRFIVVKHLDHYEVIDVIDGHVSARLRLSDMRWMLNDSYVMTTTSPWGEINLQSTFDDAVQISRQVTGPSCCTANHDNTRLGIDLENAALTVWGPFGHHVSSLQNPNFAVFENNGSAYAADSEGHVALYKMVLDSIGPVAPVSLKTRHQIVGNYVETLSWEDGQSEDGKQDPVARSEIRLAKVGLTSEQRRNELRVLSQTFEALPGSDTRGLAGKLGSEFENQMSRIGVELTTMAQGSMVLPEKPFDLFDLDAMTFEDRYDFKASRNVADKHIDALIQEGKRYGWDLRLGQYPDYYNDMVVMECDHLSVNSGIENEHPNAINRDVAEINRVETFDGPIWITRSNCIGGATYGSLRGISQLSVFDFSKPVPKKLQKGIVASNGFAVNNRHIEFFERRTLVKATDKYVLAFAPRGGVIWLYDRNAGKISFTAENLPNGDLLKEAFLTADQDYIVQLNLDGGFHFHRVADSQRVLSGRIVDDEVAIWTDDFRFDATAEAASMVELTFPGSDGQFSLDRFDAVLRTPDLARKVLNKEKLPDGQTLISLPPGISGQITLRDPQSISVDSQFSVGSLAKLLVYQDGILTDTIPVEGSESSLAFEVDRLKDARWVSVIGVDENNLESLPISADIGRSQTALSTQRALVIGVDRYEDAALKDLNFAKTDAGKMISTLKNVGKSGRLFDAIRGLKDRHATADTILEETRKLLQDMQKGDHAVFFFAGHGLRDSKGEFYLGTPDADPQNLENTALSWERIARLISKSDARVTIFLDACHSGAASSGSFASNDGAVGKIASIAPNITVLAASKGREVSQELSSLQGGVFTHAVQNVLDVKRGTFDKNGNGAIEASELYLGVKSQVIARPDHVQTPWITRSQLVGDYALF